MPMRWRGRLRKRWRWVGAFAEEALLYAAIVEVGPARMAFWGVWDRERRALSERTRRALPWRRSEVEMRGAEVRVASGDVRVELSLGEGEAIESLCPNGEGGYSWTRKLAGVPARGEVVVGERRIPVEGRGVIDDSAGYHRRRTSWLWSAGVGTARDGRSLAWNLVSGINDPQRGSERAVWVEGRPSEPEPVAFERLNAVRFAEGSRLEFEAEAERVHSERLPLIARSDYRAPLGSFRGSLGGIELASGLGVMESHDVLW
jgi:hypothetical protein